MDRRLPDPFRPGGVAPVFPACPKLRAAAGARQDQIDLGVAILIECCRVFRIDIESAVDDQADLGHRFVGGLLHLRLAVDLAEGAHILHQVDEQLQVSRFTGLDRLVDGLVDRQLDLGHPFAPDLDGLVENAGDELGVSLDLLAAPALVAGLAGQELRALGRLAVADLVIAGLFCPQASSSSPSVVSSAARSSKVRPVSVSMAASPVQACQRRIATST